MTNHSSNSKNVFDIKLPVAPKNIKEKSKMYAYTLKPSERKKLDAIAWHQGYKQAGRANVSAFISDLINAMYEKYEN